ncbi:protein GLUTAMINE DUMPER 4 [Malania oleifera]|uniref:protein GLUTAMINE DUMPER 4 n=1 Tax=Malania oleifera TaxID=397392 RepID=UPI0025AE5A32|nr:protein GLUTAMINE DUMPER 4 [Malania oleifera]
MRELVRPTSNTTTAAVDDCGSQRSNSPIPYLFGGLALMLGLIALSLLILACSFRKVSSSFSSSSPTSSSREAEEKPVRAAVAMEPEIEPKIVVIMAGDENPTYLAKPVSSTGQDEQKV